MLARAAAAVRSGEVDEQREVLAPQELTRRHLAADGHLDRAEGATDDQRGHAALRRSTSPRRSAIAGSAPCQSSATRESSAHAATVSAGVIAEARRVAPRFDRAYTLNAASISPA